VLTAVGSVEVSRPWYLCPHCHEGQFPADEELDIENTEFSPVVRRMQALVGQEAAFDRGREQIQLLAGLEVTTKSVERMAETIGADIARCEQQEIDRAVQLDLPIIVGEPVPILCKRLGTQAQLAARWYEPWRDKAKSRALALEVRYSKGEAAVNEAVQCEVGVSRLAPGGGGMLIAEVGLPPGAEVDRGSLTGLVEDRKAGVDAFEVAPDRVTFYLRAGPVDWKFGFRFRPRYRMRARTAASRVYDYYNPEARAVSGPVMMRVE